MKTTLLLLTLVGCATDDLALDPATCEAPRVYRIDSVELPRSMTTADQFGHDLDGNATVDNQLGRVSGTLHGLFAEVPLDLAGAAKVRLAGDTDWRIAIADCPDDGRLIAIASGEQIEPSITARSAGGTIIGAGDQADVPVGVLFDGLGVAPATFVPASRVELEVEADDRELTGTLGFALAGASDHVIRALAPFLSVHLEIARDSFDKDHDGVLTPGEVAAHPIVQSLLGPDLEIDGRQALSFGLRVRATRPDRR